MTYRATTTTRRRPAAGRRPRILLLALLPIGDTLLATPTVRALRARYPDARITALVHTSTAPLMCAVPAIDDVVVLPFRADWAGLAPLARTLRRLRAQRFDVAIDFTTPAYKWVSFLCGIPQRTYMKFDPLWWFVPGRRRRWRATHATRHYYDCARELDLPPWDTVDPRPSPCLPPSARDAARRFLAQEGVAWGEPLIGVHAGGAGLGGLKRWPPDRFAALADDLHDAWGARILLLGGPDERGLAETVAAMMRACPIVAVGAVPLLTSVALIECCDLFIGNDSGPLHAAAAVGTPYVGIIGPTCPDNFRPIPTRAGQGVLVEPAVGCRVPHYFVGGAPVWRRPCCRGVCAALDTLTVDDVRAEADWLLRRLPARQAATGGIEPIGAMGEERRSGAEMPVVGGGEKAY